MGYTDDRTSEYHGDGLRAWEIAYAHGGDGEATRFRSKCRVLANAGFVDIDDREDLHDEYELTSWGELYLDDDVDAELRRRLQALRPPDKVRPGWWAGFG